MFHSKLSKINQKYQKQQYNEQKSPSISQYYLNYNEQIKCEEDKYIEFKFIPKDSIPHQSISYYLKTYLNAFLNTNGGNIYFGVQDNQIVKGVYLTQKERDYIRLAVDQYCNQYVPQVDQDLTDVEFIPVHFKENDPDKQDNIYVVLVKIKQGTQPIYFTNWKHDSAYIRRNAGITKMTKEMIIERLSQGRQFQTGKYLNILGRQEIIDRCINFANNSNSATKVIILYGLMSVGKSNISEYIKQTLMQQYDQCITLKIDLKQQNNLKDSLLFLIKSINPFYDLNQTIIDEEEPSSTPSISNTFNMLYKPNAQEQYLLNIYTNLIKQQKKVILQIENVHKSCSFTEQLIPYGTQTIAILTARKMQNLYFLGPQVELLQEQILPLTEKQTAMILLTALPNQITLEQAQIIAKLTGGLPLIIRYIITKCQMEGCTPDDVIQKLNSLQPDQLTRKICPQVYSILESLTQQQIQILQYFCLPNIFSNKYISYIQINEQINEKEFEKTIDGLIDMGLIQQIQVQCSTLNDKNWYLITDIIRQYLIRHLNKNSIKQCSKVFIDYYFELLQDINKSIQKNQSFKATQEQKQQLNKYLDLFLTLEQNYECVLQIILYELQHKNLFDKNDVQKQLVAALDLYTPVLKFMTTNAQQLYDLLVDINIGKQKIDADSDSSIEYNALEQSLFI